MATNIAIVGTASTSIGRAPWNEDTVQKWTVASTLKHWPEIADEVNLWFEIHPHYMKLRPEWFTWAVAHQPAIYMAEAHPALLHSKPFPFDEVIDRFGRYFTSSISYMLALAIMQEPKWIGLYGVDMGMATEYYDQRPCCEYMIGLARGMGIDVHVPKSSSLLKSPWLYGAARAKTPNNREIEELGVWRTIALSLRDRCDPEFEAEALCEYALKNNGVANWKSAR